MPLLFFNWALTDYPSSGQFQSEKGKLQFPPCLTPDPYSTMQGSSLFRVTPCFCLSIAFPLLLVKRSVYLSVLPKLSKWNLLVMKWKMGVQGRDSSGECCSTSISVHGFQPEITSSTFVLDPVSLLLTTWGEMQTVDENRLCPFATVNVKPSFINSRCILCHLWLMLTDSTCIWNQPASSVSY